MNFNIIHILKMKYFIPASITLVTVILFLMYMPSYTSAAKCPSSKNEKPFNEIKGLPLVS